MSEDKGIKLQKKSFKNNAIITPKDAIEKLEIIMKLQSMGYVGEYAKWKNNVNGSHIVVSVGLWHCTDNDDYKNNNDFIYCGSDTTKFLEIALEKK